ncbi:MAG TPA: hypothetical protein VLB73_03740 [Patescibacteria group bacterium]|nr:hypothetical protein [Patescibacteria group bacterium]
MTEEEQPKRKRGSRAREERRKSVRQKNGDRPPSRNPKGILHHLHAELQREHGRGYEGVRRGKGNKIRNPY